MAATDYLKNARSKNYGPNAEDDKPDNDPDVKNDTSRSIKLSDEEMKALEQYQISPGEEVVLEVHGNLEDDHFHVMSVNYSQGGSAPEEPGMGGMAKQVAQLVRPQLQPSPS